MSRRSRPYTCMASGPRSSPHPSSPGRPTLAQEPDPGPSVAWSSEDVVTTVGPGTTVDWFFTYEGMEERDHRQP
jgi:hypothetical protein